MREEAFNQKVLRVIKGDCIWREKSTQLLVNCFYPMYRVNIPDNCVKSLLHIFSKCLTPPQILSACQNFFLKVEIPKPDGGTAVTDRTARWAPTQTPRPAFERTFSDGGCGFSPKRSARQSAKRAKGCRAMEGGVG
jgi:hypothetical protein